VNILVAQLFDAIPNVHPLRKLNNVAVQLGLLGRVGVHVRESSGSYHFEGSRLEAKGAHPRYQIAAVEHVSELLHLALGPLDFSVNVGPAAGFVGGVQLALED